MRAALFSFLFLYVALTQAFLGALAIMCFRSLVPAAWAAPLEPACERLLRLRWPLTPLFAVLVYSVPLLYPWGAGVVANNEFRRLYLTVPAFALRGLLYWGTWHLLAEAAVRRKAWAGGPGFVALGLSATFASVDWLLSLESEFTSTAFGLVFLLSALLLAFGLVSFARAGASEESARRDQGSVHLALICSWAYVSFMQFLVVWSGNLPRETGWYHLRSVRGWQWIPAVIALAQFLVPLVALLQAPVKRSLPAARILALATVVSQLLYLFWQTAPELRDHLSLTWTDALAFLAIAAVFAKLEGGRYARPRA